MPANTKKKKTDSQGGSEAAELFAKLAAAKADSAPDAASSDQAERGTLEKAICDPALPLEVRRDLVSGLCQQADEGANEILGRLFAAAAAGAGGGQSELAKKRAELGEVLQQMMAGPLRLATFVRMVDTGAFGRRAQVLLPDGSTAFCVVPDAEIIARLRRGDTVWLEAQGKALLFHQPEATTHGELARLERVLEDGDVVVRLRDQGHHVFGSAARLADQLDSGSAQTGDDVLVCPQRMMAFGALPAEEGAGHLSYLRAEAVPDVVVERDLGAPPLFIDALSEHLRREMIDPALGRRYGLRRSRTMLLTGVPGTGKTYSILGFWNRMYAVMAEVAGVAVEDLPPRVMQMRASEVLSKWLGESDQNVTKFFDEVAKLADEPFITPDGREVELPVLVIFEEVDALARTRGEDGIHDRIQTTLLGCLDGNNPTFRDRLVIAVFTTNVPELVDEAFLRRAGGEIARFGRMDRATFRAVLDKQLRERPFSTTEAHEPAVAAASAVEGVTNWLFAPHAADDAVQVEVSLIGQTAPLRKERRDFLTAALVERAVQQASAAACRDERAGVEHPGLTTAHLVVALDKQVRAVVDRLEPANCAQYLTLPDAARVSAVRRIDAPPALPIELERVS